jgi:hypothetical protein
MLTAGGSYAAGLPQGCWPTSSVVVNVILFIIVFIIVIVHPMSLWSLCISLFM